MNKNKITKSLCGVMLIGLASSSVFATDATSIHNNASVYAGAKALYSDWKSNQTKENDPFRRISQGYLLEKETDTTSEANKLIVDVLDFRTSVAKSSEDEWVIRKGERESATRTAYELSVGDDGTVNSAKYLSEMNNYLDDQATNSGIFYENRQSDVAEISSATNKTYGTINSIVSSDTHKATINIIQLMAEAKDDAKSNISGSFSDNYTRMLTSRSNGESAVTIASSFSSDCAACAFETTTPEAIVEPEPEPVIDDDNGGGYIPAEDLCNNNGGNKPWDDLNIYYECK